jgi:hypothetical protein
MQGFAPWVPGSHSALTFLLARFGNSPAEPLGVILSAGGRRACLLRW